MLKNLNINTNNKEEYNYIYLEHDGKIYKFKINFVHTSVGYAIEKCIKDMSVYDFILVKEDYAKCFQTPLNFLPYMGKFKLNNSFLKTKNYLYPRFNPLLHFLSEKYSDSNITNKDLSKLYDIKKDSLKLGKNNQLEIIKQLCFATQFELVEEYDFNNKVGNKILEKFENINVNDDFKIILKKLKWILSSSYNNKRYIKELGLEEIFIQIIEENNKKQIQKVKA